MSTKSQLAELLNSSDKVRDNTRGVRIRHIVHNDQIKEDFCEIKRVLKRENLNP